jgi:hypothetical protein
LAQTIPTLRRKALTWLALKASSIEILMHHHPQCQRRSTKASTHLLLLSQQLPIAPQKSIAMALVYHLALKPQVPHNLSYLQYESELFMQSHITGSLLDAKTSKRERAENSFHTLSNRFELDYEKHKQK